MVNNLENSAEIFTIYSNEIVGRIDPYYYKPEFKELEQQLENSKWSIRSLIDLIDFSNESWNQKDFFKDTFPYIEISEINLENGNIENIQNINLSDAPSRAKKIVRKDDILVSTTRPYRGAISLIDKKKDFSIGSTGFAVLRDLKLNNINKKYLFNVLKNNISLKQMQKGMTGGSYPAITEEYLKTLKIPLPPKEIQEQIIKIMDDAYNLKTQNEKKAQDLINSIDDFVLGSLGITIPELVDEISYIISSAEIENTRIDSEYHQQKYKQITKALESGKYDLKPVSDLIEYIKKGIEVGSNSYVDDGKIFLRVADFDNFMIYENKLKYITNEVFINNIDFKPQKGEILFSKDGTIGLCKVLEKDLDGIVSSGIVRIKTNKNCNNYFLSYILNNKYINLLFNNIAIGQIIKHLSIDDIINLKIPLPPIEVQKQIASEVKSRLDRAKELQSQATQSLNEAKRQVENILLQ
jgi:restriction endonuclease S subunit